MGYFTMRLQDAINETHKRIPDTLEQFSELIDPEWIQQALEYTGKASIRRRKLPAEHVVWIVIGTALYRNRSIWYITEQMRLNIDSQACVPSAVVQARQRLGHEPLKQLFHQLSAHYQTESRAQQQDFMGLSVQAVDGVVYSLPYTDENLQYFSSSKGRTKEAPYPQMRSVCLINTDTHEIIDTTLGDMGQGEITLARQLNIQDNSITLFDRAYFSADLLISWQQTHPNSHWLMRAKDNLRYSVIETFSEGDYLIQMPVSLQAQKKNPNLPDTWQARLIECSYEGKTRRYITSLIDDKRFTKDKVAQLYLQRWEIEMAFREIKSDLQQGLLLRSKLPQLVLQEFWGLMIAYNLIRRLMRYMAVRAKVSPLRISFHMASITIVDLLRFAPLQAAGLFPKLLDAVLEEGKLFVIPERRKRSCPRVVKGKPQKYPKKNTSQP